MATWQVGLGVHWQEEGLLAATQRCADIHAAGRGRTDVDGVPANCAWIGMF
jgi:hypothetical protein